MKRRGYQAKPFLMAATLTGGRPYLTVHIGPFSGAQNSLSQAFVSNLWWPAFTATSGSPAQKVPADGGVRLTAAHDPTNATRTEQGTIKNGLGVQNKTHRQTNEGRARYTHTKNVQITWKQKGSCNADRDLDEKFKQYYMEYVNSRHTSAEGLTNRRSNSAHTLRWPTSSSQRNDDDGSGLALKHCKQQKRRARSLDLSWMSATHSYMRRLRVTCVTYDPSDRSAEWLFLKETD